MGCIFSCFENKSDSSVETFLLSTKFCDNCNLNFTINEYNKHIYQCNIDYRNNRNNNRNNRNNRNEN